MSARFVLNQAVRVRHPLSPAEGRLATIVAVEVRPDDPRGDRYRLRCPDGDEWDFYAAEIRPCNRRDDRKAIITALTAASDSLRAACLIAHDYDDQALSVEILIVFSQIVGTARTHLDTDPPPARTAPGSWHRTRRRPALTWTHARATRHVGAVCGADDGPMTRVSEDPMQITCPDCPDLIWIEELPDDATAGGPRTIEVLREVTRGHMRKIDGLIVDATTAAAILTVYEVMKPPTRTKFLALDIDRMAQVAWRLLRPHV